MVSEKRCNPANYQAGEWCDDEGWIDGWDPDVLRLTGLAPKKDGADNTGYEFGSAHSSGIMAVLGDGAVKAFSYAIDPAVFNNLGHRADGNVIDFSKL